MNLDDNTSLEIIIQIRESLAKLTTQVEQALSITSNHEQRLMKLEENKGSLKEDILVHFLHYIGKFLKIFHHQHPLFY